VTSGTVYWLAICSDDILNLYIVTGSGVRVINGNTYSQGFSDPFGSVWGTGNNGAMSIYASGSQVSPSHYDFSIMQISDTQNLAWYHPDWYNQLTTWIVNNNATYNLKMVIHTGDIVDQCDDYSQWQNANASMSILANNGIPYTWCAGNHDQLALNVSGDPNTGWFGIQYTPLNPATFSNKSYWVGDDNQGKNTAVKFSVNGYNFLVINLECQANAATMAWATNLLDTYSSLNYNIIVATHAYLDSPNMLFLNNFPGSPIWEQNLQNLLNSYPRVFMTLNGHTGGWPVGLSVHNQVNGRTQTEFDRQDSEIDEGAAVRIYSFDLNSQTVTASTYSVPSSTWITDLGNSFSFSTDLTSIPTVSVSPTVVRMDLGQSQTFNSSVSGGTAPYSYQWYLNDTAVLGAIGSTWTFTPTAIGHYKVYVNLTDGLNIKVQSNNVTDIIVYPKPTTSINPVSVNMTIGNTQQFTSTTTGGMTPYTYQWYYTNGTAISGATTSSLAYKANFTGTYSIYLNVTDSLNYRAQSNTATINVYSQPTVTISPASVNMTVGNTQQFTSTITGGLVPYTYQWYYANGTAISGATTSSLAYKANFTGTYNIYLNVTDNLNYRTQSNTATINVYSQPTVTISPTHVTLYYGQSQTFSASVTGGIAPYTYQWYVNDTAVPGATYADWIFTPRASGNYRIYANVTDSLGSQAKSNIVGDINVYSAYLMLNTEPQATYSEGQQVTFKVTVMNQQNPRLETTLTLTIIGPAGYSFYDFQPINVTANGINEYSFNWVVPNVAGTYMVETSLVPAQLTAYDAKWLQAVESPTEFADSNAHTLVVTKGVVNEVYALFVLVGSQALSGVYCLVLPKYKGKKLRTFSRALPMSRTNILSRLTWRLHSKLRMTWHG
jgi:hypothetical protein